MAYPILAICSGVILSYSCFRLLGMHSPFESEHIINLERYFSCQRIATVILITCLVLWSILLLLKILHLVSISNICVQLSSLMMIVLYVGISCAFIPEICPYQLLYEKSIAKTKYSSGFTKEHFKRIRKGMTQSEVSELVGKGFEEDRFPELGYGAWSYSKSAGCGENYWMYKIAFSDDCKVEDIIVTFWYD